MDQIEWLLFLAQLPAKPSSLRVHVWRKLRQAGSTSLQNGGWILPRSDETTAFLERLLVYIKKEGASSQVFVVQSLNQSTQEDILARFQVDRELEYDEFLEQCRAFISEIEKETQNQKFTFAELEENEQNLGRLRRWFAKIQKRDFFESEKSQDAAAAFHNCRQYLQNYTRQVYIQEGIGLPPDMDSTTFGDNLLPDQ